MKSVLAFFASALLVQVISGQCIGAPALPLSSPPCGNIGYGYNNANIPTSGGAFTVTSSSPLAPTGVSVVSENNIEGPLSVNGQLPLLAAVLVEGNIPSSGSGAISYSCGSENVGITSEGNGAGPAYGNGLAGPVGGLGRGVPAGYGLPAGPRGYGGIY